MVYTYLKNRCTEYQNNPNLKKHIVINLILIILTILIRTIFEIYLRQQLTSLKEFNQVKSEQLPQENNQLQINDSTSQKSNNHLQLSYIILDQSLHLLLSLEIITLIFQITLIINKGKQELPLLDPLLNQQKDMTCSIQFVKSSNYGISSVQNNQATLNSIEMQFLSRNKGTTNQINNSQVEQSPLNAKYFELKKKGNLLRQEIPQISEETYNHSSIQISSTNLVIENPSDQCTMPKIPSNKTINQVIQSNTTKQTSQIIYSKILGRAQKQVNGKYQTVQIIQKCQKQENCNFFWISQMKSTDYFCLNCDQNNIIVKEHNENNNNKNYNNNNNNKNNNNNTNNFETTKVFQSNIFEQQLLEITQVQKNNKLKFCHNFEFCGFFWVQNLQYDSNEYYCPICQETYSTKNEQAKSSIFKEITCLCSYCKVETSEYFQSTCLHAYHYECLKELGKNQNQTAILCINCNVNMMGILKKNNMLPKETFEKIFNNQIKVIREETMHEGIEDLE